MYSFHNKITLAQKANIHQLWLQQASRLTSRPPAIISFKQISCLVGSRNINFVLVWYFTRNKRNLGIKLRIYILKWFLSFNIFDIRNYKFLLFFGTATLECCAAHCRNMFSKSFHKLSKQTRGGKRELVRKKLQPNIYND